MIKVQYYFDNYKKISPAKVFIDSLSKTQKAKIFRIFLNIETYGLSSIQPHIKKLIGTPLWEIRILGQDSIRIIYSLKYKDIILILHAFTKKSQKTSKREINIALKIFKQLIDK